MIRVADQLDDAIQSAFGVDSGGFERLELGFEVGELTCKCGLLLAGDVGRDYALHGVLGPLVTVALHLVDAALKGGRVAGGGLAELPKVLDQPLLDLRQCTGLPGGVFGCPRTLDGFLDALDGHRGGGAGTGLRLASEAEVVLVGDALGSGVDAVDEARATVAAVQRSGEVVKVLALAVAASAIAVESVLDASEEGGLVDKRLVRAGVLHAPEGREAQVVAVRQQSVDVTALELALGLLRGGLDREPPIRKQVGHSGEGDIRVVCVGLEGPADVIGALVIDGDLAGLDAIHDGADVEVADRCPGRGAAATNLLLESLDDLLSKVLAVEVGDGGEDAVNELPLGCLVDVLGDRHETCAGLADGEVDGHVIGSASRESVDLVHDDNVDVVLTQVLEHLLQLGTVGRASGLASVGELFDNHGVERVGLGTDG